MPPSFEVQARSPWARPNPHYVRDRGIGHLLSRVEELETRHGNNLANADDAALLEVETACIAVIERLAPRGSRYREAVQESISNWTTVHSRIVGDVSGILRALRADYNAGYLRSVQELVHADLFADLLEMAAHLLDSGYKDAAAVIAGSALEAHLRQLAAKAELAVTDADGRPRKAERLNADLANAGVYERGTRRGARRYCASFDPETPSRARSRPSISRASCCGRRGNERKR